MSEFTYQAEDNQNKLERFEWDRLWWEHTENVDAQRILYIGDSISCGVYPQANRCADGRLLFHSIGTSKAVDNPFLIQMIEFYQKQPGKYAKVLFNNGLHGWQLQDDSAYKDCYMNIIQQLLTLFPDSEIIIVTSTRVGNEERNDRVLARNRVAKEAAKRWNLRVIDLYSVSEEYAHLQGQDGVHFQEAGYMKFAEYILEQIGL